MYFLLQQRDDNRGTGCFVEDPEKLARLLGQKDDTGQNSRLVTNKFMKYQNCIKNLDFQGCNNPLTVWYCQTFLNLDLKKCLVQTAVWLSKVQIHFI